MDIKTALGAFAALSQETRLRAFRLLVQAGPEGLPAGRLSEKLGIPHNSLSFHLSHLSRAGLVGSRRDGRSIIYAGDFLCMQELVRFLAENCCSAEFARVRNDHRRGRAVIELSGCCKPTEKNA
jgi:DNA-binding transcriptional ArsR family regulator